MNLPSGDNRRLLSILLAVCVVSVALIVTGMWLRQRDVNGDIHRVRRASCESLNTYKAEDMKRWRCILGLVPQPPKGTPDRDVRDRFVAYIREADRQQVCH